MVVNRNYPSASDAACNLGIGTTDRWGGAVNTVAGNDDLSMKGLRDASMTLAEDVWTIDMCK